jgi:hypothetical protein
MIVTTQTATVSPRKREIPLAIEDPEEIMDKTGLLGEKNG